LSAFKLWGDKFFFTARGISENSFEEFQKFKGLTLPYSVFGSALKERKKLMTDRQKDLNLALKLIDRFEVSKSMG
jgi:hypothetical protein